jgi:hypothetical protein
MSPIRRLLPLLAACALAAPRIADAQSCPQFTSGVSLGTVDSSSLTEVSGIAVSRRFPNVLWAHDDSGDSARVFAVGTDGTHLGIFNLSGASAVDWEDMAIGTGPVAGQDYLYVADTGNNALDRAVVTIYRAPEPALDTFQLPVTTAIGGVAAFPVQYPGGVRRDAETLLVDPVSGDWFLVTRDRSRTGSTYVYLNPYPQQPGVTTTLQLVATLASATEIKGGDVAPAGDLVLLRTHSTSQAVSGLLWPRAPGTDLESVFATSPCAAPLVFEPQGEAVAFAPDGLGYYTLGEGANQPIYFYGAPTPPAAPGNVAVVALSSTQARVTWTDVATNESGYRVERSTNGGAFAQVAALAAGATSHTDGGLSPSTPYAYRVVAHNAAGATTSSTVAVTTPASSASVPSAPTNLTATAISSSRITLRWTDTASNESGFRIERSTNGVTFSQIGTVGANAVSATNTGLQSNRTYWYRVRAYNAAGNSAYSNTASARTRR